jgi:hypothetical protein
MRDDEGDTVGDAVGDTSESPCAMFSAMVPANRRGSCPTYLRWGRSVGLASASARLAAVPQQTPAVSERVGTLNPTACSGAQVANRNTRIWHGATGNGPCTMHDAQTFAAKGCGAMILSSGIGRVRIPYRPIRKTHPIWWRSQRTLSAVSGVPSSLTTPAEGS